MAKYDGLATFLAELPDDQPVIELSFNRIDALVGGLPPSSRRLRTWWANNSQTQSLAWNKGGWHVESVDLTGRAVVFARGRVGGTYPTRGRVAASSMCSEGKRRQANDGLLDSKMPIVEPVDVRVVFDWSRLGMARLDAGRKIVFPGPIPAVPGVYRFTLTTPGGRNRLYIGESDNLRRRLGSNYRTPGPRQQTSLRVNALLVGQLDAGGGVEVDISVSASIALPGSDPVSLDLGRKAGRLLAENAALVLARHGDTADIENVG